METPSGALRTSQRKYKKAVHILPMLNKDLLYFHTMKAHLQVIQLLWYGFYMQFKEEWGRSPCTNHKVSESQIPEGMLVWLLGYIGYLPTTYTLYTLVVVWLGTRVQLARALCLHDTTIPLSLSVSYGQKGRLAWKLCVITLYDNQVDADITSSQPDASLPMCLQCTSTVVYSDHCFRPKPQFKS